MAELTEDQIAKARMHRAKGMSYPDIAAAIDYEGEAGAIRHHCLDVPVPNGAQRNDKPISVRKDGAHIRRYTPAEDDKIITWAALEALKREKPVNWPNLNQLAKSMGRMRHSVLARIKTLRKHGKLPAE